MAQLTHDEIVAILDGGQSVDVGGRIYVPADRASVPNDAALAVIYRNQAHASITGNLNDLDDVSADSPLAKQGLYWNATTSKWTSGYGSLDGVQGAVDGSAAPTGMIGEVLQASVLVGSAVALTNNTVADLVSLPIPAGDWDIEEYIYFVPAGATVSYFKAGTNISGAFSASMGTYVEQPLVASGLSDGLVLYKPRGRLSLASLTTWHLLALAKFSVGTVSAYGLIRATRVR